MSKIQFTQLAVPQAEVQLEKQKVTKGGRSDLLNILDTDIYHVLKPAYYPVKVDGKEIPWDREKYPDARDHKMKFYGTPD